MTRAPTLVLITHGAGDADGATPPLDAAFAAFSMPLDTTSRMLAPFLDRLSDEELDTIPYGVIQLKADGTVLSYNKAEAKNAGGISRPIGRHFFLEVCPSASGPELEGRFRQAIADRLIDDTFHCTLSSGPVPRRVQVRMYYSVRTRSVWLFVAKPDGSPLERVMIEKTGTIVPTPSYGVNLRVPRVA